MIDPFDPGPDYHEYLNWILPQLPPIEDERDVQHIEDCILQCKLDGFSREDALAYTLLTEHANPTLEEEYACREMAKISSKYPNRRGAKKTPEEPPAAGACPHCGSNSFQNEWGEFNAKCTRCNRGFHFSVSDFVHNCR